MASINNLGLANYQVQTKKVAAQDKEDKQPKTQQAETQDVKQLTLQQPTVKVPLANLQLMAGVNFPGKKENPTKFEHFDTPENFVKALVAGTLKENSGTFTAADGSGNVEWYVSDSWLVLKIGGVTMQCDIQEFIKNCKESGKFS